ncbi:hypothetical protein BX661DRAFT_175537 [Kickxella alabastrina]|uniref:uncharacterized protein n=1 Tax=Kickxella alabastrina TaxID=61397 RepID=UPI00221F4CAD|nr:uncharacterized protein BX661DRAFT_175537 [Kickxella alabastrina]KAI7834795.1 hypothetical protein BX661DRAFT_175537 [Kickxella alabastrina]KAJ1947497.1 hypothetical protein GGF37_000437 [Kickxella alabastrina]
MKPILAKVTVYWLLATSALLATTTPAAAEPRVPRIHKRVVEVSSTEILPPSTPATPIPNVALMRHPRQLLSNILDILNPGNIGKDSSDSESNAAADGEESTQVTDDETTPTQEPSSTTPTTRSTSRNTSSSRSMSDTETTPTSDTGDDGDVVTVTSSTTQTRASSSTSKSESSTKSSDDNDESTDDEPTDTNDDESTPTPTDSSSSATRSSSISSTKTSLVLVTVTRPGTTITAMVSASPTIDQANGEKADVGAVENLTTVIVAPTVAAVALLLLAILFFLHKKRKNRIRYDGEDAFASGPTKPYTPPTKPYAPPNQVNSVFNPTGHSNDGYVKEENDLFTSNERRMGDHYSPPQPANDNTQLLPNSQYQQQQAPFAQHATGDYMQAPGAAPVAGGGLYGVPLQQQPSHQSVRQPPQPIMNWQQQPPRPQQGAPYNNNNNGYWA